MPGKGKGVAGAHACKKNSNGEKPFRKGRHRLAQEEGYIVGYCLRRKREDPQWEGEKKKNRGRKGKGGRRSSLLCRTDECKIHSTKKLVKDFGGGAAGAGGSPRKEKTRSSREEKKTKTRSSIFRGVRPLPEGSPEPRKETSGRKKATGLRWGGKLIRRRRKEAGAEKEESESPFVEDEDHSPRGKGVAKVTEGKGILVIWGTTFLSTFFKGNCRRGKKMSVLDDGGDNCSFP